MKYFRESPRRHPTRGLRSELLGELMYEKRRKGGRGVTGRCICSTRFRSGITRKTPLESTLWISHPLFRTKKRICTISVNKIRVNTKSFFLLTNVKSTMV